MSRIPTSLLAVLALGLLAPGCKSTPFEPPFETFKPGVFTTPKGKVINAPEAASAPWRVMAFQEVPRQKKNPQWKSIAVSESGEIEMPERSSFKCIYNPAVFRPEPDEYVKGVEVWGVLRSVRCSNDGFRTHSELSYVKSVGGDGTYVPKKDQAELSFSDLVRGKRVRITLLLRPD